MSGAPVTDLSTITGASLLDGEGGPILPATSEPAPQKGRGKKKAVQKDGPPSPETRTLPAPEAGPTKAEAARADGQTAAARATLNRELIGQILREMFHEEDALAASIDEVPVEEKARLLSVFEAEMAARERMTLARIQPIDFDAATAGCALEELVFWEREAERVGRLYEAMLARAKKKHERVERVLWPLILEYCKKTPREGKAKSWKFPTTRHLVQEREDHEGHLEVKDVARAVNALDKILGQEQARKLETYKVETRVLVSCALPALRTAKVDLSKVDGFAWTPPGSKDISITRRS